MTQPDAFAAIADDNRRHLLEELRRGPRTVSELAGGLPVSRPAVSQHLAKLRMGRLVQTRRDGVTVYYRHANDHVSAMVRNVLEQAEHVTYEHPPHHA